MSMKQKKRKYVLAAFMLMSAISVMQFFCPPPSLAADVLYIGDSHSVGPFGVKMDELVRSAPGVKLDFYAVCGSVYSWWLSGRETTCGYFFRDKEGMESRGKNGPTPLFKKLLKKDRPEIVIVEIGANYWDYPEKKAVKEMRKMAKKIRASGAECYWITTPDSAKIRKYIPGIMEYTRKAVSPYCRIFDSTTVTSYPDGTGDGLHYAARPLVPLADRWAEAVFKDLKPVLEEMYRKTLP